MKPATRPPTTPGAKRALGPVCHVGSGRTGPSIVLYHRVSLNRCTSRSASCRASRRQQAELVRSVFGSVLPTLAKNLRFAATLGGIDCSSFLRRHLTRASHRRRRVSLHIESNLRDGIDCANISRNQNFSRAKGHSFVMKCTTAKVKFRGSIEKNSK
jgi:hypothetical protein